jgi:hypothetical protein
MWTDSLSLVEAEFTERAIAALGSVGWARPLLVRLESCGGITSSNLPLLFEVRVAYELHRLGRTAEYEFAAGVGGSTIDFRVEGAPEWFIETASAQESEAVREATTKNGALSEVILTSSLSDNKASEEGELLLLEQKIGEKVWHSDAPTKFPLPHEAIHLVLMNTRGFNLGLGDKDDYDHATQGISVLRDEFHVRYWNGAPIKGLFEHDNPLKAARSVQERIHFIGFVRESEYRDGEIRDKAYLCPNPHLFSDNAAIQAAYKTFPLKP